jgi:transglycosylase-like protein with SLT domain
MSLLAIKLLGRHLTIASLLLVAVSAAAGQNRSHAKKNVVNPQPENTKPTGETPEPQVVGKEIRFADGSTVKAEEVWKSGDDYWYRLGGVTQRVGRSVKSIEPIVVTKPAAATSEVGATANSPAAKLDSFWVMLKGGARMKVDEVDETEEGAWCRRENFSFLIARDRIDRIERDSSLTIRPGWRVRDWTTGNPRVDQLIKANGNRFGVDPYLVFCVIEHESHFKTRAVSPKGAQGLMQLMPGTAARFGVRNPFDPAENIYGGTQYLKELLKMFGRVDLALASYNAGEGAVLKYGGKIPPYRETREYVRRISNRYGTDPGRSQEKRPASPE